jgi:RimJ/RimL family protein N-acetyltransferase
MLETERLILRRFDPVGDLDDFARAVCDAEVMRFVGNRTAASRREAAAALERYERRWTEIGIGHLAIERKADRRVLGRVGVVFWDADTWRIVDSPDGTQMELGWLLARDAWGYGYATEAARAARAYVLEEARAPSLVSVIAPENDRSQAVARKLGATLEKRVELADHGPADVWLHPR